MIPFLVKFRIFTKCIDKAYNILYINIWTYMHMKGENMETQDFVCGEKYPHYQKINKVKLEEPNNEEIENVSNMFKLFADNTRLRIICSILNTELCVCDLCELLELNQSTVSHQLQILRNAKLVKYRREGKQIYYSLQDEHIEQIISTSLAHILEEEGK